MKIPYITYIKWASLGVLLIFLLTQFLKFIEFLIDTFYRLKEKSPFMASSLVVFLIFIVAALVCFFLYKYLKSKKTSPSTKKTIKNSSIKSQKKLLADAEANLADPKMADPIENKSHVRFENDTIKLIIYGYNSVGKSSLLTVLKNMNTVSNSENCNPLNISLDEFDLTTDEKSQDLPKGIFEDSSRFFLLMSDKDLRDFELKKFQNVTKDTTTFLFALNKTDLLSKDAVAEIQSSIYRKFNKTINSKKFVAISAEPRPKIFIKVYANGNEIEKEKESPPDVDQLINWLNTLANEHGYSCVNFS